MPTIRISDVRRETTTCYIRQFDEIHNILLEWWTLCVTSSRSIVVLALYDACQKRYTYTRCMHNS